MIIVSWFKVKVYFQRLILWVRFLQTFHLKVSSFGVLFLILAPLFVGFFFALIVSVFIDPESCPQVWLKFICDFYPNCTYGFFSPACSWKVVEIVPVECNCQLTSINLFDWSKISFKLFTLAYIHLLLTCEYCINCIIIHWSCNLSSGVIEIFPWDVSKPYIRISYHRRFVAGCGGGH